MLASRTGPFYAVDNAGPTRRGHTMGNTQSSMNSYIASQQRLKQQLDEMNRRNQASNGVIAPGAPVHTPVGLAQCFKKLGMDHLAAAVGCVAATGWPIPANKKAIHCQVGG